MVITKNETYFMHLPAKSINMWFVMFYTKDTTTA